MMAASRDEAEFNSLKVPSDEREFCRGVLRQLTEAGKRLNEGSGHYINLLTMVTSEQMGLAIDALTSQFEPEVQS